MNLIAGEKLIDSMTRAHALWARTNSDFAFMIMECGVVCAIFGVVSGSVEVMLCRITRWIQHGG